MNETNGEDEPRSGESGTEIPARGPKNQEALAHLAFLQRELLAAEAAAGKGIQIDQLIEANQQLVLAALSAQEKEQSHCVLPHLDELPGLYSKMREANEQLVVSALHAQKLQVQAEQALARQKSALATVAHEMRNPLTPISMLAERMTHMPTERLPGMCALIESQVMRLSRMVEDLLDVSRANTGKLRLTYTEVDIGKILNEVADACSALMTAKNLRFSVRIESECLTMNGDAIRVAQIFTNVLTNAVKYTPSGGEVWLSATANAGSLEVVIRDNGIGISSQALPFIFEPYVQDAHAIDFNATGLGIGLTVVRELVEAHSGTVTAHSEGEGKGSLFTIMLPLSTPQMVPATGQ